MKIAIRVDSAAMIGSGHLMRCLTLAERLKKTGADILFICRNFPGDMNELIVKKNFIVHVLPFDSYPFVDSVDNFIAALKGDIVTDLKYTQDVLMQYGLFDWVVVDHYALDKDWEQGIRKYTGKIWVIDDLANRFHDCDVLLDQNYQFGQNERYKGLVPQNCKILLGPKYLLLREEFLKNSHHKRIRTGTVERIQIFFGGSDPTGETLKALKAVTLLNRPDIHVDVIVGQANPKKEEVQAYCSKLANVTYYCQVDNMAELMVEADLAIGAGGSATWERCFVGLPALSIVIADNQRTENEEFEATGAFINLGWHEDITVNHLADSIRRVIEQPDILKDMSNKAKKIVGRMDTSEWKDNVTPVFWWR